MDENANNFQRIYVEKSGNDPVMEGVDGLVVDDAAPVTSNRQASVLARASKGTTLSTTRKSDTHAVVVRSGNVVAVGDASFLQTSAAYDADNEVFIGNLVEFLVTGDKDPCVPVSDAARRGGYGQGEGEATPGNNAC